MHACIHTYVQADRQAGRQADTQTYRNTYTFLCMHVLVDIKCNYVFTCHFTLGSWIVWCTGLGSGRILGGLEDLPGVLCCGDDLQSETLQAWDLELDFEGREEGLLLCWPSGSSAVEEVSLHDMQPKNIHLGAVGAGFRDTQGRRPCVNSHGKG